MKKISFDSYKDFHESVNSYRGSNQGQIILKLTNLCNVNCKYCYNKEKINETLEMNINIAKQGILKIGPAFKNLIINLTGGDINLYSRDKLKELVVFIEQYIEAVKDFQKVSVIFHPNIVNIDNEMKEYIKKFSTGVGFSYDGLCNEINRNCSCEKALNKMNELNNENINYNLLGVLTKETINNMDKELDHMTTLDRYLFHNPPTDHCLDDYLKLDKTDFATFYIKKLNYLLKSNKIINEQCGDITRYFEPFIGRNDCTTGLCRLMSNLYVIEPNGDIIGCPLRTESTLIYCNIKDINNIYDIFLSKGYLDFEKLYFERLDRCKSCKTFSFCNSGCLRGEVKENFLGKDNYCKDIQIIIKYIQLMIENNIDINDNIKYLDTIYKQIRKEYGNGK